MSDAANLLTGLRVIMARPEARSTIEDSVGLVLEYVKGLALEETPALLKPLRGLEDAGAEWVIHFVLGVVDTALKGLEPAGQLGTATFALKVKEWPKDLPQSPFESMPDGGGRDRNQE